MFGAARLRIRIKTVTQGGTLDAFFVGPDFRVEQLPATAYASLVGTVYATGGGDQATVTAGTEANMDVDVWGEGYVLLKFTGGGTGTIGFVDVSQV